MRKSLINLIALATLASAAALAQPVIQTSDGSAPVANAFSELAGVSPGGWFVVKGTGLGPTTIVVKQAPFDTSLAGTSVTFTPASGGTPISTWMYYTLNLKLAALLPSSTAPGDYDVKVTYNGQTSAPYRVKVVARNFGFATQSSNGKGPGPGDLRRVGSEPLHHRSARPVEPAPSETRRHDGALGNRARC